MSNSKISCMDVWLELSQYQKLGSVSIPILVGLALFISVPLLRGHTALAGTRSPFHTNQDRNMILGDVEDFMPFILK